MSFMLDIFYRLLMCAALLVGASLVSVSKLGPVIDQAGFASIKGKNRTNINGPSVVTVPEWVHNPLGRYYMYFSDHNGQHIDLAYANKPEGPFTIAHTVKPLHLKNASYGCTGHIVSSVFFAYRCLLN